MLISSGDIELSSVFMPIMQHHQHQIEIRTPIGHLRKRHSPPTPNQNLAISNWKIIAILLIILNFKSLQNTKIVVQVGAILHEPSPVAPFSAQQRQQVSFAEPENDNNVQRVAVGRQVRFKCVVNNIGDHKVAWFHKDRHILLAIDNKTIAWRERIQVSSQADSVFVLQIDSVQLSDKGHYICQLNTQPARSQTHILDVVKPPQIREHETTINIEPVKEFSPVELRCVADGIPRPTIKWRRESQTFELPIFDEIETDTNELDDHREQEGKIGETNTGDRLRKNVEFGSSSSASNSSLLGTQVASQVASSANQRLGGGGGGGGGAAAADSHESSLIRTDDIQTTTKTIVKRQSGVSLEPNKKCSPNRAQLRLEQVEQDANFGSSADCWQDMLEAAPESRRAPLMMTARRKLIARSAPAASQQQNWRQRHPQDDAQPQSIDSDSVLAGRSDTTTTSSSAFVTSKPFIGEGETFRIERVSRYDMGYYMCIASNGVPPSVAQRIFLPVSYVSLTKNTNQTNTTRAKENNAAGERAAAIQANNNNNNNNTVSSSNLDKSVKVREGTRVSHAEPNLGVGSGRSYHRHRQLKAARSSSVSSASSLSVAASLATTTKAVLLTLSATLGIMLMI